MKYIALSLSLLCAFWCGALWMEARKPNAPVYITKATVREPKTENCVEVARACYQRKRMERTKL